MTVSYKTRIGNRLTLALFASLSMAMLIAANGMWKGIQNDKSVGTALAIPLSTERLVSDWNSNITSTVMRTTVLVHSRDSGLSAVFPATATAGQNDELIRRVGDRLDTDQERVLFAKIVEIRNAYHAARDAVLKLKSTGHAQEAVKLLNEQYLPLSQHYQKAVSDLLQLQRTQVNEESSEMARTKTYGRQAIIALSVLAFLAGAALCWALKGYRNSSRHNPGKYNSKGEWDSFYETLA
ncbi:MAG: MCP four helix bundle domain-containing protein [Bacillota bacterium]